MLRLFFFLFLPSLLAAQPMNLVFILADDLGWSDTTLHGTTKFYHTPNLERLARRGMTFTRAYSASPLCSPTRSAILTGLSPARTGITTPNCHLPQVVLEAKPGKSAPATKHAISPETVTRLKTEYRTLAEVFRDAGYATGHFGKWHLGAEPYSPLEQGFDVDVPHHAGPGPAGSFVAPWKFADFKEKAPGEHLEDRMAAEASAWMEQQRDRPFFLNYWQFSVHAPFDAKKALVEKNRARVDPSDAQRSPTYAAMVESLDDAVGTLLDTVDRLGLAERTVIVFTSDNGGNMYNEIDGTTPTSNRPLRGGKATMFEGGTRVPCLVAWPGLVAAGSHSVELVQSEDFFPTLVAGLLSQEPPPGDGVSLLPALRGEHLAREAIFQYFPHDPGVPDWLPASVSVHQGDWKLIRLFHAGTNGAHRHLLFDLVKDPGEKNNLTAAEPRRVAELDALIEGFLERTGAVRPLLNPAFDPSKYRPELEGKPASKAAKKAAPTVAGWQVGAQSQLRREGGELVIQSTGGDPWISTRRLPKGVKGPFRLELSLSSHSRGEARVYFATPTAPAFARERSLPLVVTHSGKVETVKVDLPVEQLTALRLDPSTAPGTVRVTHLVLIDAEGARQELLP
jgi:arylsulfatase A-like enzyme